MKAESFAPPLLFPFHSLTTGWRQKGSAYSHDDTTQGQESRNVGCASNTNKAQTMLNCIDNSGAAIVECVAVMKKRGIRPAASIGMKQSRRGDPLSNLL